MHFSNNVQDKDSDCKYNYLPITRFNLIAEYKSYVLKLTFLAGHFLQVISRDLVISMLLNGFLFQCYKLGFSNLL